MYVIFTKYLEKIKKNIFSPATAMPSSTFFVFWAWILPFLFGITIGWLCMVCVEVWINGYNNRLYSTFIATAVNSISTKNDSTNIDISSFLKTNPFKITTMPSMTMSSDILDSSVASTGILQEASLLWPFSNIGAVLESQGKQQIILLGRKFNLYMLKEVNDRQAIFVNGEDRVVKDLIYGSREEENFSNAPPLPNLIVENENPLNAPKSIVAANPKEGVQGRISREMLSRFVNNPMATEVQTKHANEGILIEVIPQNSILGQLGFKEGDIIRSINGEPMKATKDLTGAMNSLKEGNYFDVEVKRDETFISLQHVID